MTTSIAILRGINVSGHRLIKMEALRNSFEAEGFKNVRTYIQSGNVVFESPTVSTSGLEARIEARILADYGFEVPAVVRTAKQLEQVIRNNPFASETGMDASKLHVTFVSKKLTDAASGHLQTLKGKSERFQISGSEIYLHCPEGYGNSRLANPFIEKKLSAVATTRNWKTLNALLELAKAPTLNIKPPLE